MYNQNNQFNQQGGYNQQQMGGNQQQMMGGNQQGNMMGGQQGNVMGGGGQSSGNWGFMKQQVGTQPQINQIQQQGQNPSAPSPPSTNPQFNPNAQFNQASTTNNWNFMKQQSQTNTMNTTPNQSSGNWGMLKGHVTNQQPQMGTGNQVLMGGNMNNQMGNQQSNNSNWNFMKQQMQQPQMMNNQNQYSNPQQNMFGQTNTQNQYGGGMQNQYGRGQGNMMNQNNYGNSSFGNNQLGGQGGMNNQFGNQQQQYGNQQQYGGYGRGGNQMYGGGNMGGGGFGGFNNNMMGPYQGNMPPPITQQALAPNMKPQSISGTLKVTVVGCNDLKAADMNGKSDPYVILSVGASPRASDAHTKLPKEAPRTKTQKSTLFPLYNESFDLRVTDSNTQYLYLDVFDWDRLSKDDHLGTAVCPLNTLSSNFPLRFELAITGSGGQGSITISLQASQFGYHQQFFRWCQESTQAKLIPKECGTLKVRVIGCKGLMAADTNGKSDPYCILRICGGDKSKKKPVVVTQPGDAKKGFFSGMIGAKKPKKIKTKVQKATLNPLWQETFRLKVPSTSSGEYLRVDIFDWDMLSRDDPLGFVTFPLQHLVREHASRWASPGLPIQGGSGTLQIEIEATDFGHAKTKWEECMRMTMGMIDGLNALEKEKRKRKQERLLLEKQQSGISGRFGGLFKKKKK